MNKRAIAPRIAHNAGIGFRIWRQTPQPAMSHAHTHPDVEVNCVPAEAFDYQFGGERFRVEAGKLAIFWGGREHRLLRPGITTSGVWLTLPLALVLEWRLPNNFAARLLQGELSSVSFDFYQAERWLADFECGDSRRRRVILLEIEAFFNRLALSVHGDSPRPPSPHASGLVERITDHIARRYREETSVESIADAVGLNPKYLMRIFKRSCGLTIWDYLTKLRISHAQTLLATTELRIIDVAQESGFGSPAAFYQAFRRHSERRVTPTLYRDTYGAGAARSDTSSSAIARFE